VCEYLDGVTRSTLGINAPHGFVVRYRSVNQKVERLIHTRTHTDTKRHTQDTDAQIYACMNTSTHVYVYVPVHAASACTSMLPCLRGASLPRRSAHDGAQCVEVHVGARSYGAPRRTLLWCLLDSVRRGAADQRDSVRRGAEQMGGAAARVPRTSASAARVPRTSAGRQNLCTLFVSRSLPAATRRGLRVYERRRPCKEAAAHRPSRHTWAGAAGVSIY
jgi:hypothetical protein